MKFEVEVSDNLMRELLKVENVTFSLNWHVNEAIEQYCKNNNGRIEVSDDD